VTAVIKEGALLIVEPFFSRLQGSARPWPLWREIMNLELSRPLLSLCAADFAASVSPTRECQSRCIHCMLQSQKYIAIMYYSILTCEKSKIVTIPLSAPMHTVSPKEGT
jgi:hypothetical protein